MAWDSCIGEEIAADFARLGDCFEWGAGQRGDPDGFHTTQSDWAQRATDEDYAERRREQWRESKRHKAAEKTGADLQAANAAERKRRMTDEEHRQKKREAERRTHERRKADPERYAKWVERMRINAQKRKAAKGAA
jgi:hypothetical protein